ncbi:MAG: response regulator [Anaerolineae bacterium]|jgi:DNA-binding response OmpR family regulator
MVQILSLDDSQPMGDLLALILNLAGYQHRWVADGGEALSILRDEPVDLLTQDVMRPGIDGLALYEILKADEGLADLPVLFITAGRRPEFAAECLSRYGDGYLLKPFLVRDLLEAVAGVLTRHGKHPPPAGERADHYAGVRPELMARGGFTAAQIDALYDRVSGVVESMEG